MKIYKNRRGTYSKRRFSKIQAKDPWAYIHHEYGIYDFKKKIWHPIKHISRGRWKFYNKNYYKLADINYRHIPRRSNENI